MKLTKGSPRAGQSEAKRMTHAMKQLARKRANGLPTSPATLKALEARGLVSIRKNDRWHWTPLGRRAVMALRVEESAASNAE